jgi:hypothetical protein
MVSSSEYHRNPCGLKPSETIPESGHALGIASGGIDRITCNKQRIDPLIDRHVTDEPPGAGRTVGFLGHPCGKRYASSQMQVCSAEQFHSGFLPVVPA